MSKKLSQNDGLVVQTEGLTKRFGPETAVDDLTFDIPRGRIFGLIGPSGCGKTTTVRLLMGIYQPTSGEAMVLGENPQHFSRATRARIGYMLQHSVLYPDLSVWQNLQFASSIYGVGPVRAKRLREILDFVELQEHRRKPVHNISGGMQRRLSLAATLVHDPTLVFLDEPTTGVDPVLRRKFWDRFDSLRDEGRTLLVTTQYVSEAAYCDLVAVLQDGRLLMVDTPVGLRKTAFGGDVIEIRSIEPFDPAILNSLKRMDCIEKVTLVGNSEIRVVVDDAGTATPHLVEWAQAQALDLQSVQEYLPPFDDVFVKLVEKKGNESDA